MMRNDVDFIKNLRTSSNLTLSSLSDLSGYSVSKIYQLERESAGSPQMAEEITSILLQRKEEGLIIEVRMWRDRALRAEDKLAMIKSAMRGWMDHL